MPEGGPGTEGRRGPFDREIGLRGLVGFGVGLALLLAVTSVAMWGLFRSQESRLRARETPPSPLVGESGVPPPPEPRLQTTPAQDLAALVAMEDSLLRTFGWVDPSARIARIPIDRALALLLGHGVPVRAEPREWTPPGAWRDPSRERLDVGASVSAALDSLVR